MAQCGPGAQLTADFSKMQGMAPMGQGPMGMGADNDMGMMDMGMAPEMHMQPMIAEFQQMSIQNGGAPNAMATAGPSAVAYADPQIMPHAAMGMHAPLGGMMHPMGGMMGMPMMGGPQLMYPHMQMQMQMQTASWQQQAAMQKPLTQTTSAPLPQAPLPQIPTLEAMLAEPLNEGTWMKQFQTDATAKTAEDQESVKTFGNEGEDLRTVEDKTSNSEFYGFMQKVNDGRVVIDEENSVITEVDKPAGTDDWAAQLAAAQAHVDEAYGPQMAGHIPNPTTEAWRVNEGEDEDVEELYRDGADHYNGAEEFYDAEMDGEAWANEYKELLGRFADAQNATDYPFEPENAFMFHDDPLSEGKQLLAMGILSDAVLAFEAACQKDMENFEAWKLLGNTQAENEKDMLAIRALNKAKQINPHDREVYMALSVSHANESNNAFALESLRGWLLCQPEYEVLVDVVSSQAREAEAAGGMADEEAEYSEFLGMMASPKEMQELTTLFGAAIEMNPADASLHVALGIAHHISQDFESAIGCFKAAVDADPSDPKVWNKLGATMANSSNCEEAIRMYERALDLNPGYVRARYNMGIAYNNLGRHEIAAQHFARAIVMQQGGAGDGSDGTGGPSRSTREMWDALRMALNFTNRSDLVQHTWKQDIKPILEEYGLSDLAF